MLGYFVRSLQTHGGQAPYLLYLYLERLAPDFRQVTRGMSMMSVGSKETAVWTATGRRTGLSDVCCVDMDVDIASQWSNGPKMPDHVGVEGAIRLSLAQADIPLRQPCSTSATMMQYLRTQVLTLCATT